MSLPDELDERKRHNQPGGLFQKYSEDRYDTLIGVILAFAMAIGIWIYAVKPWQTKQLQGVAVAETPPVVVVEQLGSVTEPPAMDRTVAGNSLTTPPPVAPEAAVAIAATTAVVPSTPVVEPLPMPVVAPVAVESSPVPVVTPVAVEPSPTPVVTPVAVEPTPIVTPVAVQPSPAPIVTPIAVAPTPAAQLPSNVVVRESIEFDMGKAKVPESAKTRLVEVATLLKADTRQLKIVGHTDSIGFTGANRRLSLRRANAVKAFLVAEGVNPERLSVAGEGEAQPIDDNNTAEGRHRNRRIEIIE